MKLKIEKLKKLILFLLPITLLFVFVRNSDFSNQLLVSIAEDRNITFFSFLIIAQRPLSIPQQLHHEKEHIDEIQIQGQRPENGFASGFICAIARIIDGFDLLGVIGGQTCK